MITTYSFISCLLSRFLLWKDEIIGFVFFHHLAYVFDCMDGQMARKYDMTSKFGDIYDHTTDLIGEILLLIVVIVKFRKIISISEIVLTLFVLYLTMVSVGCYQTQYENKSNLKETIGIFKPLCFNEGVSRFAGVGTWIWFETFMVVWLYLKHNELS